MKKEILTTRNPNNKKRLIRISPRKGIPMTRRVNVAKTKTRTKLG